MQVGSPFGAISHIKNDAIIRDKFFGASLACIALQFHLCDGVVGDVHAMNYTMYHPAEGWSQSLQTLTPTKRNLLCLCRRFLFVLLTFFGLFQGWNVVLVPICIIVVFIDGFSVAFSSNIDGFAEAHIFQVT